MTSSKVKKDLTIKLKSERPQHLRTDIIEAVKHSIQLCQKLPSLYSLQTISVFQKLLKELKEE